MRILRLLGQNCLTVIKSFKLPNLCHLVRVQQEWTVFFICYPLVSLNACIYLFEGPVHVFWRRAWQPTPMFFPGESPWTEKPEGLQSIGSQRVRHDWCDLALAPSHYTLKDTVISGIGILFHVFPLSIILHYCKSNSVLIIVTL